VNESLDEHDANLRDDDARGGLVLYVVLALWVVAVVVS
jgi:hypothetical protein